MSRVFRILAILALGALLSTGCASDGAECCSCLADNGCWDFGLCPRASDCNYFYDEGFSGEAPSNPCQAWTVSCQQEHCAICSEVHSNFQ